MSIFIIETHFAASFPFGDLSERYGYSSQVGAGLHIKTKRNIKVGFVSAFLFGRKIKEDVLAILENQEDFITGFDGLYGEITLSERGFSAFMDAGKLIPVRAINVNSGVLLQAGVGALYHKIKIQTGETDVPQLNEDMKKGYDRLTYGPAIKQYMAFEYHSENRKLNGSLGVECIQGFTSSKRTWQYDLNRPSEGKRIDILLNLRATFMIPVYFSQTDKYYYY